MKKKFSKIWGVALTLVMVLTLAAAFSLPVGASPGENEWSKLSYPDEGADGDWFRDANITEGPGPIAMAIDGTLYAYAKITDEHLFKSEDGGRSWDKTDYEADLDDIPAGTIVDIACSSLDADILYVTDGAHVYWTEDGGDKWETVAKTSLLDVLEGDIKSVDVGYNDDEEPYVFIGSAGGRFAGSVYYIAQGGWPSMWTDLQVGAFDVYAVAASPEFADSGEVFALITNDDPKTGVYNNLYGAVADWEKVAELEDEDEDAFEIDGASRICFPADFDDEYEMFVGVCGVTVVGSVYRVDEDYSYRLEDEVDEANIISLDLVGDYGNTSMVAGAEGEPLVFFSTDDGDEWDDPDKNPSGEGPTYVVMAEDFADTGIAWAAVSGEEGAVSLTVDGGELYNQISLIATNIVSVDSTSFSREYETDETMFMVTSAEYDRTETDSLFRYDGDNWERVFESTLFESEIDQVQLSPDFVSDNTLFVTSLGEDPVMYRSTDGGQDFSELGRHPEALTSWIVIDDETVIAGTDDEVVWKTTNHGRRAWDDYDVDDAGIIISFALSPDIAHDDTIILGDDDGQIFISEDAGEEWDLVEEALDAAENTFVIFDPDYATNDTIYAASGDEVDRCVIDPAEDWEDQEWDEFTTDDTELSIEEASGLVVSANGTLYAADATEVDANDGGVWRALNPTDDMEDVVFELVGEDLDLDTGVELSSLQVTAGSNVLWSRNAETGAEDEVWTYEDTLATEVVLTSPADGAALDDTDEVTFKWKELTGADEYYLKYTDDPEWEENVKEKWVEETFKWVDGLDDGTTYYWKVKVAEGEPLLSRYSDERSFTTALEEVEVPVHWTPENGEQDVIITPSFGWTAVSGATGYEFELADNPEFADATTLTPTINSCLSPITLDYSTSYYWKVRGLKDTKVVSEWVSGAFTTMAEPVPPVEVEEVYPPEITVEVPPAEVISPAWIYVIIAVGAILVIAVIILIVRTRRVV